MNKFTNSLINKKIEDGKYIIRELIGSGGMGYVFKIQETENSEKFWAIKILKPEFQDFSVVSRFQVEASVMRTLNHENIVSVISYGKFQDTHYFIMEYLDGHNLGDLLDRKRKIHWLRALAIAYEIDNALRYAHESGIIHRDIKPSNILLTKEGKVKITDFGLAKVKNSGIFTATGVIMGTPQYMSPEQWDSNKKINFMTDYFSLGAVLYHMIVGKPPFGNDADHNKIFKKVAAKERIINPRYKIETLPEFVDDMIMELLQYEVEKRKIFPFELVKDVLENNESTIEKIISETIITEKEMLHVTDKKLTYEKFPTLTLNAINGVMFYLQKKFLFYMFLILLFGISFIFILERILLPNE